MRRDTVSQFCERVSRFLSGLRLAALSLALSAACGAALAAPADDHREGERAYRQGDLVTAAESLRRAADAGHAPSQVLLANILDQAEYDAEALAWYRKAAAQGNADGEFGVGAMYLSGEGVARDLAEAYRWLLLAAERGHELATIAIANSYLRAARGELASSPDPARAAEWLRKAAAFDSLAALDALAEAYRAGNFGLTPDAARASEYAARAAAIRRKMAPPQTGKKKK
jgi:TPR repeat protein